MATPDEMRARAAELENRVSPVHAGPRTDDERMWLEKAAALRAEANRLESTDQFVRHMAAQDPDRLEADRAAAWGADCADEQ
jgi:hypothetical protein